MSRLLYIPAPTRRVQLACGLVLLFLFLSVTFPSQTLQRHLIRRPYVTLSGNGTASGGRRPYDSWQPPPDWNGGTVVYDHFDSLDEQFASSLNNLESPSEVLSGAAWDAFPAYKHDSPSFVSCKGPRGHRFNESGADTVFRGRGRPRGYAEAPIGSSTLVGFEQDACYDRVGRHKPYGLRGKSGDMGNTEADPYKLGGTAETEDDVAWETVDWEQLQRQCFEDNRRRFDANPRAPFVRPLRLMHEEDVEQHRVVPRTAIVFRTHQDQEYTEEIKRNLRAVITELALHTGAEYAAYLLVHIRDPDYFIWANETEYQRAIRAFVPPEFQSIAVLWNQDDWKEQYPGIPDDLQNIHMSQWLPMQYFQKQYPQFDYYWNWEMDIRYTGHYFDLVKSLDRFTASQPRKGLWERNERFYLPRVHGTYTQFRDSVQARYMKDERGRPSPDSSVWGPRFPGDQADPSQSALLSMLHTQPPVPSPDDDQFEWGVGEPADFVTFLPMFNPYPTRYVYHDTIRNYGDLPERKVYRRTTIITLVRLSGRLLRLMEAENKMDTQHYMSSETWPHSVSLHYGLKAVYVPHSIYFEQDWPANALDFVFNNGDQDWTMLKHPDRGRMDFEGEGSGGPESPFGMGIEHNWDRSTWYYKNRFAERLYRRWMGWDLDGSGGPAWEAEHGRFCLPPMLLHPIKSLRGPEEDVKE